MGKIQTERYFENVRTKYGDKVEILSEYQGKGNRIWGIIVTRNIMTMKFKKIM